MILLGWLGSFKRTQTGGEAPSPPQIQSSVVGCNVNNENALVPFRLLYRIHLINAVGDQSAVRTAVLHPHTPEKK
jgi:hypothetical protein